MVSLGRLLLALWIAAVGGIQVGLYMADWYDDAVAEPLSLWIGIGILALALVLAVRPYVRRRPDDDGK